MAREYRGYEDQVTVLNMAVKEGLIEKEQRESDMQINALWAEHSR